jgi:hypothetical protein
MVRITPKVLQENGNSTHTLKNLYEFEEGRLSVFKKVSITQNILAYIVF